MDDCFLLRRYDTLALFPTFEPRSGPEFPLSVTAHVIAEKQACTAAWFRGKNVSFDLLLFVIIDEF